MIVHFFVEGDPVPKGRPRLNRKTGTVYTPKKTRHYEDTIKIEAKQAMSRVEKLQGPLALQVIVYLAPPKSMSKKDRTRAINGTLYPTKKPDWDNVGKTVSDACNLIAYKDDAQITDATILKRYSDKPGVDVTIWTIES